MGAAAAPMMDGSSSTFSSRVLQRSMVTHAEGEGQGVAMPRAGAPATTTMALATAAPAPAPPSQVCTSNELHALRLPAHPPAHPLTRPPARPRPAGSAADLASTLQRIEGRGFKAYTDIEGRWQMGAAQGGYALCVDWVQADPFASPSRCR